MSVVFRLDGRTSRGRVWKELTTCGKPINQGIIQSGKMCSNCSQCPDFEKDVIKCMKCNHSFHICCLLLPITEDDVKNISENPSLWWFCVNCTSAKSGDVTASANGIPENNDLPYDVMLKTTLATFKKDILSLVSETIDRKFQESHETKSNSLQEKWQDSTLVPCPKDKINNAWAIPASPLTTPLSTQISEQDSTKDKNIETKREKHILLLDPNDPVLIGADKSNKRTIQTVSKVINDINVNFCKVKKSGVVALGFEDNLSKKKAAEKIKQCSEISEKYSTRSPKKLLPKVTVLGINEVVFDECNAEDKEEMKSILLKDILKRNSDIKNAIDSNPDETVEVVMIQKSMPSDNVVTYSAALKMSSNIRKLINDNGNKLYVSLSRCRVIERYHILQCYHCQKPGHHSNNCPDKDHEPTCLYCSGKHTSKMCTDKSKRCCSNCLNSSDSTHRMNAHSHTASGFECPALKPYRERVKYNTENWSGKN